MSTFTDRCTNVANDSFSSSSRSLLCSDFPIQCLTAFSRNDWPTTPTGATTLCITPSSTGWGALKGAFTFDREYKLAIITIPTPSKTVRDLISPCQDHILSSRSYSMECTLEVYTFLSFFLSFFLSLFLSLSFPLACLIVYSFFKFRSSHHMKEKKKRSI